MSTNPYHEMPLGYFNALMATVMGSDQERETAKEYLKEIEPDIWED